MLWYQLCHSPNPRMWLARSKYTPMSLKPWPMSHPKSEMWPARGKHTPMPPKPWPTSYLFKIRHDLSHSGRLPTCEQHNPQAVTHHTTCTQSRSIINYIYIYIKMYTTLSVVNRVSLWHRLQQHYTWQKKKHETPLDDSTQILHQATTSCQKWTVLTIRQTWAIFVG